MFVIFCAWLACLAVVFLMAKLAPSIEEESAEDEVPDDRSKTSEFGTQVIS
jgi:hypothetical protein